MISVIGTLPLRPEHVEDFLAHAAATSAQVAANEPGVLQYLQYRHPSEPNTISFIEIYADAAALQRHAEAPYIAESIPKLQGWLAGPPEVTMLTELAVPSAQLGTSATS